MAAIIIVDGSMYEYSNLSNSFLVRKEELAVHPVHIFDLHEKTTEI